MIITYYGKAFVKLQFGDMIVALNPISKESKAKTSRFGANIALASLKSPDFSGVEMLSVGSKEPFVIDGPGEYELSDVFIKGYESVGPEEKLNTIYTVLLEGMRICHLGALAFNDLKGGIVEDISGCDVLFVPVGGNDTLSPKEASKMVTTLIPKIVIPVLFGDSKSEELKEFLKEVGAPGEKSAEKISLKKKDLEGSQGRVVLLQAV